MSARRVLLRRLQSLEEIAEILHSLQTLAMIETHKLTRLGATQHRLVAGIERAAADLCNCFPHLLEHPEELTEIVLLLGSERGFCADYNENLLAALVELDQERPQTRPKVLAVGSRLFARLEDDSRVVARLAGASAAEEVPVVLSELVDTVLDLENRLGPLGLAVLHHELETQKVRACRLLPPFAAIAGQRPAGTSPQVNLPLHQLFAELVDHYLMARLNQLFHTALLAENQRRVQHLEGAKRRVQEEVARLGLKANALRQEEIIEEIEVLLLSAR
jgi:F-type H+-transporting ATPase subunit gamma